MRGHLEAAERPPNGAVDRPEAEAQRIDRDARLGLVGGEVVLDRPQPQRRPVVAGEAPHGHATESKVLVRVAEMGDLPVEHACQARTFHQQIAHPVVAVVEHGLHLRRAIVLQPLEAERDDRTIPARLHELRLEVGDGSAVVHHRNTRRHIGLPQTVNTSEVTGNCAQHSVGVIAGQDDLGVSRPRQRAHDEAAAEPVRLLQHRHHFRRGHALGAGRLDQRGFNRVPVRPPLHKGEARRAAQDIVGAASGKPPAFHHRPASKTLPLRRQSAETDAGTDPRQPGAQFFRRHSHRLRRGRCPSSR